MAFQAYSKTIYVDGNAKGKGDGSSWPDAFVEFSKALKKSGPGDEILVAEGTYYPSNGKENRDDCFLIGSHLKIQGGYAKGGGGRDWEKYETVLSGDIGRNDKVSRGTLKNNADNAYTVIKAFNAKGSVLDGFTITSGYGRDDEDGSGLHIQAWHRDTSAVFILRNCKVIHNRTGVNGAGMYFRGKELRIENCTFKNNRCTRSRVGQGGSVFIDGHKAVIVNSRFEKCRAYSGGALFFNGIEMSIEKSKFSSNVSDGNGGAGVYFKGHDLNVTDTDFKVNSCDKGKGGAVVFRGHKLNITGGTFIGNAASGGAGVVEFRGEELTINRCHMRKNTVGGFGGSISAYGNSVNISDCRFEENSAQSGNGGVLYYEGDELFTANNTYIKNTAASGGVLYTKLNRCHSYNDTFNLNSAVLSQGGAVYFEGDSCIITRALFSENSAKKSSGGAISFQGKRLRLDTTVFYSNTADTAGALLFANDIQRDRIGSPGLESMASVFRNNKATRSGGAVFWMGRGVLKSALFENNGAQTGGAIYCQSLISDEKARAQLLDANKNSTLEECNFRANHSSEGSVIHNWMGLVKNSRTDEQ